MGALEWSGAKVRNVTRRALIACGIDQYHRSEDRRVLEMIILPYFAGREDVRRVLFVGCAWYTRGYRKIFRDREYTTIEVDPMAARFGARRHLVDSIENIRAHFAPGTLDLVVCNGVFGWGLNERPAVERAFGGCVECLRPGGYFVLGWNDVPERCPFPPEECVALGALMPHVLPSLGVAKHRTDTYNRHTFRFYQKSIE